jgi:D-amino-acid dehydrogenase
MRRCWSTRAHLAQAELVRRVHRIDPALPRQHRGDRAAGHRRAPAPVRWAEAEGIDFDLKRRGILHIYRDKAGFDHAGGCRSCWPKADWNAAPSPRRDARHRATLAGQYYGGYYTESDATGDIHKFTSGLAAAARGWRADAVQPGRAPYRPRAGA